MAWTVIIEDETGTSEKELPYNFTICAPRILSSGEFKVLCYLDPYGNTTFNALMFADLITDLKRLKEILPADKPQIEDVLQFVYQCQKEVHTYLKFYGD